jgi:hypothetical protein
MLRLNFTQQHKVTQDHQALDMMCVGRLISISLPEAYLAFEQRIGHCSYSPHFQMPEPVAGAAKICGGR